MLVKERIKIIGMDCPTCAYSIQRNLTKTGCVSSVEIDVSSGNAVIEYDSEKCSSGDIYKAVRDAGYDVEKERLVLSLREVGEGEAQVIEARIADIPGVFECRVSPVTKLARVTYNPLAISGGELLERIRGLGLEVGIPKEAAEVAEERGEGLLLARRLAAFLIGLFAVAYAMIEMYYGAVKVYGADLLLGALAAASAALGLDIITKGFKSLARLTPTMNSLVALSVTATIVAGVAVSAGLVEARGGLHASSFFEASAGVMGFIGLGMYLEERTRRRAFRSLEELAKTLYGRARVIEGEAVVEKAVSSIQPGEVVEVKAGEIIPVDGVVIEGWGYVDESSYTGEPTPRFKSADNRDPVLAGSILASGYVRVRVTRAARDTVLYHIVETVREAQFYKPRIMRVADRIVGAFVWAVIAIASLALIYWWLATGDGALALMIAASVLAIACPCALGIAVPMAVSIAVLRAARSGILVRRGDAFERANEVDVVIFDKTGTLTVGKPSVKGVRIFAEGVDERQLLAYICAVESRSEHPISTAILSYCSEKGITPGDPSDYVHMPGMGVIGVVGGVRVAAGNVELMKRLEAQYDEGVVRAVEEAGNRGLTAVLVAVDKRVVGLIEIGDTLRAEAKKVIDELKALGLKTGVMSGDTSASVNYYARALGLDMAFSELRPGDKAELVKEMQRDGRKVMFVGDGVNDALAISSSFLGVAVGSGSEIAKESGDLVLTRNRLEDLVLFFRLSKAVRRKIFENIAWAFAYNVTLIPIAAGLLYASHGIMIRPEMAALAMVLSDVSIVANSVMLLVRRL